MKLNICLLASLLMFTSIGSFADVAVPYGEGSGKANFINNKKYPGIEEPLPIGPSSFRMVEDKIWIADGVSCKLMQFDNSGKLVSEFSIVPDGEKPYDIEEGGFPTLNYSIEDIAPVRGDYGAVVAWWISDSLNKKIYKFSTDGKKLAEIYNPEFVQPHRIEVGIGGHVFVTDMGKRKIFVFDGSAKFLYETAWEWSGFAVAGQDEKLYRLMFDNETKMHNLIATDLNGKVISGRPLKIINMLNPELWWVDEEKNECVITYTPQTGFEGKFIIVRVSLSGEVIASGEMTPPLVMNRFIDNLDYGDVFVGKANYNEAPNGKLEIIPFNMPSATK